MPTTKLLDELLVRDERLHNWRARVEPAGLYLNRTRVVLEFASTEDYGAQVDVIPRRWFTKATDGFQQWFPDAGAAAMSAVVALDRVLNGRTPFGPPVLQFEDDLC